MIENEEGLTKLKDNKTDIKTNMQKLKKVPTDNHQTAYEKIVEFYGYYNKLVDSATNPSGNYPTYIKNYNDYSSDFKSTYDQLVILIPEIKDYKTTSENNK